MDAVRELWTTCSLLLARPVEEDSVYCDMALEVVGGRRAGARGRPPGVQRRQRSCVLRVGSRVEGEEGEVE